MREMYAVQWVQLRRVEVRQSRAYLGPKAMLVTGP